VMRNSDTEAAGFNASGSGPMHDRLRGIYDNFLRGRPEWSAEQCFAAAWSGLSLTERNQIRDEESGEAQRREAEGRAQSMRRAVGRGGRTHKMKHEQQVETLLKAARDIYEDDELTAAEREAILADTFVAYTQRTGRDGLGDIAGVPITRTAASVLNSLDDASIRALIAEIRAENPYLDSATIARLLNQRVTAANYRGTEAAARRAGDHATGPYENLTPKRPDDIQGLALVVLEAKAAELRKAQPGLSEAQAFSKAVQQNPDVFQMERAASRACFAQQAAVQSGAGMSKRLQIATRDGAVDELWKRADELRKADPKLSREQAFAKVYSDRANRDLARAEREASAAALASA
jgi:hypothetical protein